MTVGTAEATPAVAVPRQNAVHEDTPFFAAIKKSISEVCGTGAPNLREESEVVKSASIVETTKYQICLKKTRRIHAGGMPAGVETVLEADFSPKVDEELALYQRRVAPMACTWLEKIAPQHGKALTGGDLVVAPAHFGYSHQCLDCAGRGELPCTKCRSTGSVSCHSCGGSGKCLCSACGGNQRVPCTACFGMRGKQVYGYKTEYNPVSNEPYQVSTSEFVSCFLCAGSGTGRCFSCTGGYCNCSSCGSSGVQRCRNCAGAKSVTCEACQRHGVVTVIGSIACVVEPITTRHMECEEDLKPVVKRTFQAGILAPLLHFKLASSSLENDTVSTRYEAPFDVTVAEVSFKSEAPLRSFYVRSFGPEHTLTDFDGLLEVAMMGDLELVEGASSFHAYFSRKKRRALADALAAVMLLEVHRSSVSSDDRASAGTYVPSDPAYREKATKVLHRAIGRLSSVHQCQSLLAGVGAGLAVFAGAVLAFHSFTITGFAYGAGAALMTWAGFDVYRRFQLRRTLGLDTYKRALATHAAQLHLRSRPVVLILLTVVALTGLARLLPGHDIKQETTQILTALKSTLPPLKNGQLDALASPRSTTFIENKAALITEIDALKRTADAGNPKALAVLGRAYIYGIGVPVDLAEADKLITRAESIDSTTAKAARAFYNLEKTNPKSTRMTGLASMKELAAAGDIDANLYLGLMFNSRQEPVFTRNPREAKRYLELAAAGGSAIAAEQLETMPVHKRGKPRR